VRELAKELSERSIPLVSDDVFHRSHFGNEQPSAADIPGAIVVGDMSKCLSLPGLRIGWIHSVVSVPIGLGQAGGRHVSLPVVG
jgi:aspartate/methionine/tyrosine aminotransferase